MTTTEAYNWESYELWQDHCPHSITQAWQHRKTVAADKMQEKTEANRAAVIMDVPVKTAQDLLKKSYPGVALDEILLEEALDVLRPYAAIRAAMRENAAKNNITIYTIINRMRTMFPGKTFCDLTKEDQAKVCQPPKPYVKREPLVTKYARDLDVSPVGITNRMRSMFPGKKFAQLTDEERLSVCRYKTEYIKKDAIMTKYARKYNVSADTISRRLKKEYPGRRFDSLTDEQRISLCYPAKQRQSRAHLGRVKTQRSKATSLKLVPWSHQ